MSISIASLRKYAEEAGHAIESEVGKFITFIEGKAPAVEAAVKTDVAKAEVAAAPVIAKVAAEVAKAV